MGESSEDEHDLSPPPQDLEREEGAIVYCLKKPCGGDRQARILGPSWELPLPGDSDELLACVLGHYSCGLFPFKNRFLSPNEEKTNKLVLLKAVN